MIGRPVRARGDFAPYPAGTLFNDGGVRGMDEIPEAVAEVKYLGPTGYPELIKRRIIVFEPEPSWGGCYYYAPIGETHDEVLKEVLVILDLIRAAGYQVKADVKINLEKPA